MGLLDAGSVLLVHAHPDDETIATGALALEYAERGAEVSLLTATRGERGEVVAGPLAVRGLEGAPELAAHRERELEAACAALGIRRLLWLGTPPARADGRATRQYSDSGMRWIAEGVAGPADDTGPGALAEAPLVEAVADVSAALRAVRPALVISYDAQGGYGHPDHVRVREAALAASRRHGIAYAEVLGGPEPGGEWHDLAAHRDGLVRALRCHASQVRVEGDELVHSGGQRQPLPTAVGLRHVAAPTARDETDG